jgi:hypothetical protein
MERNGSEKMSEIKSDRLGVLPSAISILAENEAAEDGLSLSLSMAQQTVHFLQ